MLNDFLVFRKIKNGDIHTFEIVFRQYYSPLCFYALSITGRKEVAEEIVQEVFYIIWKERDNIELSRSLKNYLYRAVHNQSLRYQEHLQVEEKHHPKILVRESAKTDPDPHEYLEYQELEKVVNQTLEKLPERRLKIFRMHRFGGVKYKEIAERLSISVKTVEAEMTKAYRLLQQEVEKYTQANHGF